MHNYYMYISVCTYIHFLYLDQLYMVHFFHNTLSNQKKKL